MADNVLFREYSHLMGKGVSAFFIIRIRGILFVFTSLSLIFLTKNYKYCRLSIRTYDSLQLFLYLCSQNLTNL